MTLAALIQADRETFLNPEEFGVEVQLNGFPVVALVDDEGTGADDNREGASLRVQTLTMRTEDLPAGIKPQREVRLDGETWVVSKLDGKDGLTEMQVWRELS